MDEPDIFDALRDQGVDADDPEVRLAVRRVLEQFVELHAREGGHTARRCMDAARRALTYALKHPDVADMSSFEDEFDGDS